ncbi:MAG TPA: DUF3108 domain-containing protein [Gammaproteobacteria bacterium]|nr:DUF3108 domain-containing protein [Gammaproteobacteria bacterium]
MLKRMLPALLILLAAPAFAAPAVLPVLLPYTATYSVITHGIRAGEAQFKLEKLGKNRWRFSSDSHTTGLVSLFRHDRITESSVFTINDAGGFDAREYHYSHTGDDEQTQDILFDWNKGVALSTYRGDKKTIDIPKGASDPFLAQLKLSRQVAEGMTTGRFPVVNRNKLDVYNLKVTGRDGVSVPGGTFTAVRVVRGDAKSSRKTIFWLAPKLNYVPVKVEQVKDGDSVFRLELRSIDFK